MTRSGRVFLVLLLPLLMGAKVFDRVIATVNDEPIFSSEFEQYFRNQFNQNQVERMSQDQFNRAHDLILNRLVDELLIMQYINQNLSAPEKENIRQVVEQQTEQMLQRLKDQYSSPEQLLEVEQNRGMSWEDLRINMRRNLRRQYINQNVLPRITRNLVDSPTQEEIEQYKQDNPDVQPTGTLQIAHILLRISENESEREVQRKYNLALQLAEQARTGADFAQLARQYSEHDASKEQGGRLPPFQKGEYLPQFNQLFELNRGAVPEPIRTELGFHVVKVVQKNTFEDMVFQKKWEEKTSEWVEDLREKATINVFPSEEETEQIAKPSRGRADG